MLVSTIIFFEDTSCLPYDLVHNSGRLFFQGYSYKVSSYVQIFADTNLQSL